MSEQVMGVLENVEGENLVKKGENMCKEETPRVDLLKTSYMTRKEKTYLSMHYQ